jgi:3-methyladenine DNA glycosylase AlkD
MSFQELQNNLENLNNPDQAIVLKRFFKTGPGEYGEGDLFRGIKVPQIRILVNKYSMISLQKIEQLLHSQYHEDRLCALLMLVKKMMNADEVMSSAIYDIYMTNTAYINNWDLVDLSAEHIPGAFLFDKSKKPLYIFAKSDVLWERRIALLSTFNYIKKQLFEDSFAIASLLLNDKEDLIHKATGWMLREIGKRNRILEENFIKTHYSRLHRTTLRYAIEHFPEKQRIIFLKGTFND